MAITQLSQLEDYKLSARSISCRVGPAYGKGIYGVTAVVSFRAVLLTLRASASLESMTAFLQVMPGQDHYIVVVAMLPKTSQQSGSYKSFDKFGG